MLKTTIVDRYGRPLDDDDIVPDGGVVRVPMPFMDALSARTNRAFMRDSMRGPLVLDLMGAPAGHRPGYVMPTDDWDDPTEAARQLYIQGLTNAWRGPVADNAEGVSTSDPLDDIAQLPTALQLADSADAAADLEAVRAAYQAEYVRRISNAWKT
jgi:hypothetical protein